MQTAQVVGAYWLIWWTEDQFSRPTAFYMGIYAFLGVAQSIASFLMGLAGVYIGYNASKTLFTEAATGVLHAPMSFFDTTPLGRIMNRFSKEYVPSAMSKEPDLKLTFPFTVSTRWITH
jgi:ATP-binding cassette subfamily C (CFTR/MRP) protein 1